MISFCFRIRAKFFSFESKWFRFEIKLLHLKSKLLLRNNFDFKWIFMNWIWMVDMVVLASAHVPVDHSMKHIWNMAKYKTWFHRLIHHVIIWFIGLASLFDHKTLELFLEGNMKFVQLLFFRPPQIKISMWRNFTSLFWKLRNYNFGDSQDDW